MILKMYVSEFLPSAYDIMIVSAEDWLYRPKVSSAIQTGTTTIRKDPGACKTDSDGCCENSELKQEKRWEIWRETSW